LDATDGSTFGSRWKVCSLGAKILSVDQAGNPKTRKAKQQVVDTPGKITEHKMPQADERLDHE
jgi:hypothetical protein